MNQTVESINDEPILILEMETDGVTGSFSLTSTLDPEPNFFLLTFKYKTT